MTRGKRKKRKEEGKGRKLERRGEWMGKKDASLNDSVL
jgi:hypothetical protein